MPYGFLRISTFEPRLSAPVHGAAVEVYGEGLAVSLITDGNGLAEDIAIEAPDRRYSLDESNTTVTPYSTVNLTATAPGYQPLTLNGIQIFDGQVTEAQLEMTPATDGAAPVNEDGTLGEVVNIPPHPLFAGGGGSGPAPTEAELDAEGRVLRQVIIPRSITVHLARPNVSARNVTVSFREYVANVASSEVYPTWPENALRANIHAIISLALNRIFTEWYPSRGYSFNITNSPGVDQAYVHGRTVFEVMRRLTEEIFNTYARRIGFQEPYYTEYCDGKSVSCAGMSQWGTVDRANAGLSPLNILRYYYGNSLELVTSNSIQGIPSSYPGSALRRGSTGENVRILQRQLNRIARDYPSFGTVTVDGVFGAATEAVVKRFQRQFGLTVDGIVGKATWYKVSYIYVSVTDLAELTSEGLPQSGVVPYPGTALRRGSTGSNVRLVQSWLNGAASINAAVPSVTVDGSFGSGTQNAVRAFQRAYGLTVDGVVGRDTWTMLNQIYLNSQGGMARGLEAAPQLPISLGSEGETVGALTQRLALIAYYYPAVESYGYSTWFDQNVEISVRSFQRQFGLDEDGVVGKETWALLGRLYFDLLEHVQNLEV